jgi:hypothetical protein
MSEHQVKATVDRRGYGTLEVDGTDLTQSLHGFDIAVRAGDLAHVALYLFPGQSLDFEGIAEVSVARTVDDPGPAAVMFLTAIDPEILEREALNSSTWGSGPGASASAMIEVLVRWARGGKD